MPERRRLRRSPFRIAAAIGDAGVYTVPVAARLLHERPATVERWAFGYRRRRKEYPAAISTDIPPIGESWAITFLRVLADRLDHAEAGPDLVSVSFRTE